MFAGWFDDPNGLLWWYWVTRHHHEIWERTLEHLQQTVIAVGVGFAVSLVLAAIALRFRWSLQPINSMTAILYTIPSLALFALLIPVTGLTLLTAEIALVSYTLINLVPNIVAGIDGVPPEVVSAADGLGLTRSQRFRRVELPLAIPEVMAGVRIATVSTIGLVTISSYVGLGGGFGALIADGRQRAFPTPMVLGVVGSVLLAIAFDLAFVALTSLLTPWRHDPKVT